MRPARLALASLALLPLAPVAPGASDPGARARDQLDPDALARACAHYDRVLVELEARTPPGLTQAQLERRRLALRALAAYRERADFGHDTDFPGERVPGFVDGEGRRCAVADLMHVFGRDDLVERVARTNDLAYVADLAGDAEIGAWLADVGLTLDEAARIQGPLIPPRPVKPGVPGAWKGPGDGRPAPSASTPAGPGARPAPSGPATPGAGPGLGGPSDATTPGGSELVDLADWSVWWEYNKLAWLVPNRLVAPRLPDGGTSAETPFEELRRTLLPRLAAGLHDGSAEVRAAAAVAYGRSAGPLACDELTSLLDDASPDVRRAAVLALGACGSEKAVHELLELARDGRLEGSPGSGEIAPAVRPTAVLALGLARRLGVGARTATFLPDPTRESGVERRALAEAALLQEALAPSDELARFCRERIPLYGEDGQRVERDGHVPTALALEALRHADASEGLSLLLRSLGSRDIEERRSAAATLGVLADPRALQPLLTAFEVEADAATRGLLAIAIGRRGGSEAREFLMHQLTDGPRTLRPWTALALGVLARDTDDDEARAAIRAAWTHESNQDARGAYPLAAAIARDAVAAGPLRLELAQARSPRTRMYAGLALGMLGGHGAREALRAAIERESSPVARAVIAQGLGLVGDPRDADLLLSLLADVQDPIVEVQLAAALAFHGSAAGAQGLSEALAAKTLPGPGRAAATRALGILLSRPAPFLLTAITEDANYAALPAWLDAPLQTTL